MIERVAVIGDTHLLSLVKILPDCDSLGLQLEAFRRALLACRKLKIKYVIQAGDLFHSSAPDDDTKLRFADLLCEFEDLRLIFIPGNHDRPLLNKHSLKVLKWLGANRVLNARVFLKPKVMNLDGIRVFICPHPYIEPQPDDADISVGHFAWNGARYESGHIESGGSSPPGRWVLADFHEPQSGPRYHYVGSITQTKWDETPVPRGFSVIQRVNDKITIARVPIEPTYTLQVLEVTNPSALETINPADHNTYYRIMVPPGVELPDNWQKTYPAIVDRKPLLRGQTEKLRASIERVNLSDDPFDGFPDWIRERGNLNATQSDWAMKYIRTHTHG